MRHKVLSAVAALGIAACGSPAPQKNTDAKAPALEPAVINAPLTVPMPKAEAPNTPVSPLIPSDSLERVLIVSPGYALITAMMINQDERQLSNLYLPIGVLQVPDTTIKGNTGIVRWLASFAKQKSLADFQRTSRGMRVLDDSTLADSGTYVMTTKRTGAATALETGRYSSRWRARKDRMSWVIMEDRIVPDGQSKRKVLK